MQLKLSGEAGVIKPTMYKFHTVRALEGIVEGENVEISINGWNILVCRYENRIYAVENRCSHQGKKLSGARLRKGQIICPVHGARFDLVSGAACSPPATCPIVTFTVRELDGIVGIALPTDSPSDESCGSSCPS